MNHDRGEILATALLMGALTGLVYAGVWLGVLPKQTYPAGTPGRTARFSLASSAQTSGTELGHLDRLVSGA